jgi:hypothetical protein
MAFRAPRQFSTDLIRHSSLFTCANRGIEIPSDLIENKKEGKEGAFSVKRARWATMTKFVYFLLAELVVSVDQRCTQSAGTPMTRMTQRVAASNIGSPSNRDAQLPRRRRRRGANATEFSCQAPTLCTLWVTFPAHISHARPASCWIKPN